jgi:hypothetical protein
VAGGWFYLAANREDSNRLSKPGTKPRMVDQ